VAESKVRVDVAGRSLTLSNLEKVLYPASGFTKGEVVDYYVRVADPLIAHIRDRPMTRKRWPDGVGAEPFFEKNAPRGTPDWVRTVLVEHGEGISYVVVDDLATLVWVANLAALELHVPQWTVGPRGGVRDSDLLVFDLDPGPPASIVECCRVAELLRERLAADGLQAWAKTSGNKGAQLYVPVAPTPGTRTSAYAKRLAAELSREHPDLVVATMSRQARPGKVYVDWSQNNAAKTTIAPYSLRGTEHPQVSTPLRWDEVSGVRRAGEMVFSPDDAVARLEEHGDLLAGMREARRRLPDASPAG
jgi:bifunctional non-homologous end joining protein LigD